MSESNGIESVESADAELIRLVAGVTIGWIVVFFLASLGLVLYGDVLADLFV